MKAQRRHDLQTNTLVESLNESVDYIKSKAQTILLVILVVVVVIAAWTFWRSRSAARQAQASYEMLTAVASTSQQDPNRLDTLERVARENASLRAMAYAQLGSELLGEATYTRMDPQAAGDYRQRAEAAFQNALDAAADQPKAAAMARIGLATILADRGEAAAARQHLQAVRDDAALKGTPYPEQATAQLEALEAVAKLPPLPAGSPPAATPAVTTTPGTQPVAATQPAQG